MGVGGNPTKYHVVFTEGLQFRLLVSVHLNDFSKMFILPGKTWFKMFKLAFEPMEYMPYDEYS